MSRKTFLSRTPEEGPPPLHVFRDSGRQIFRATELHLVPDPFEKMKPHLLIVKITFKIENKCLDRPNLTLLERGIVADIGEAAPPLPVDLRLGHIDPVLGDEGIVGLEVDRWITYRLAPSRALITIPSM